MCKPFKLYGYRSIHQALKRCVKYHWGQPSHHWYLRVAFGAWRFWLYAFQHYFWLENAIIPLWHKNTLPLTAATGQKEYFSQFCTFGCCVWVHSPWRCSNVKTKIYQRYFPWIHPQQYLKYDEDTQQVKLTSHVHFDAGMNDLPVGKISFKMQLRQQTKFCKLFQAELTETCLDKFHLFNSLFSHTIWKVLINDRMTTKQTHNFSTHLVNSLLIVRLRCACHIHLLLKLWKRFVRKGSKIWKKALPNGWRNNQN